VQLRAFYNTPLGELYQSIPFDSLSKHIPKPKRSVSGKGCRPWFDVKGGIGLQLQPGEQIKDKDIVGRWRSYLGQYLDVDKMQISCVQHWKP